MTEDPDGATPSDWILEPPEPGQIRFGIAVGSEVELTPEARRALESLLSEMHEDEVSGFMPPCGSLADCSSYQCLLGKCLIDSHTCLPRTCLADACNPKISCYISGIR